MKEYLKKNGIRLGVVIIAVVLVALLAGRVMGGKADFLTNAIVTVREPIRQAAASVANWLDGAYGYLFEYEQLKAENESLRIQLAEAQERERLQAREQERQAELEAGRATAARVQVHKP